MRVSIDRRQFLRTAVAGGLAGWGSRGLRAADPISRNGKPHLKLSLAAYSFRDSLTAKESPMSMDDFIRLCADYDLDGCELTSYYFPKDFDDSYLIHLRELTFKLGLDVSGTAIANDFCLPEGDERNKTLAHTKKWIDHAALFGAPVIRIFAGKVPAGDTDAAAIARCAAGINEALEYAGQKGVCLALENHGGITATSENMLKIIEQVRPSPWFGVNLDSGNFFTPDPYADLARIAPYAINAQLKTEIAPSGGNKQETDLEREIAILKQANYRGYVVLEYEAAEDPFTAVPRHLDRLRKLIRG
ncbi:MAG: sugar phosphate isomerase/epimerase [Planctomycetaceae bacterium]|nr:sugar phosphate isomerase/epimerase [Planctomycetaceae bacterium]